MIFPCLGPPQRRRESLINGCRWFCQMGQPHPSRGAPSDPVSQDQSVLGALRPFFPRASRGLVHVAHPRMFHDFPPFSAAPPNRRCPWVERRHASQVSSPTTDCRQRLVPQGRDAQLAPRGVTPPQIVVLPPTKNTTKPPVSSKRPTAARSPNGVQQPEPHKTLDPTVV